ncbi:MAG: ABC transporter permease [Burkholderiaceae bacterium]
MKSAVIARWLTPLVLGLGLWQGLVLLTDAPPYILPGPGRVMTAGWHNAGLIASHAGITALEVALGLLLGSLLGIATALVLMMLPRTRQAVLPLLVFSQAVPVFALAPLLTLWFGYGIGSKILMAVLIIFFPVTSSFLDGLQRTDRGLLDLADTLGAGPVSTLFQLRVPAALPSLGSGLRLAAVYAPIGAVIGEWVGASRGLGYLMLLANGRVKTDLMFAALLVLALLTVLLYTLIARLAGWLTRLSEGRAASGAARRVDEIITPAPTQERVR